MIDKSNIIFFDNLELLAHQAVEGFITGLHKSPFHGFSVEFAEHRHYNTGESTRHIDWKLFARTDKFFVKRYEEETNLRCHFILDQSSSMYFPNIKKPTLKEHNKISFSIYSIATLMNLLKKQRDAVGLSTFSNLVHFHVSERTTNKHHRLLLLELEKAIQNTPTNRPTFAVDSLHEIAEKIHQRSLVIIFSDMMDNSEKSNELFSALQHLKFNKHEVILFHVVDKAKELKLDFENQPHKFIDLESGEELKLTPKSIQKEYQKYTSQFLKELKLKCAQFKIDFIEADIQEGIEPILLSYLVKRRKMN